MTVVVLLCTLADLKPLKILKILPSQNRSHQISLHHSFHFSQTQFLSVRVIISPLTLHCTECLRIPLFLRSYLCSLSCSSVISQIINGMVVWCLHCSLLRQIPSSRPLQGDQGDQGPRVSRSLLLLEIVGKKKGLRCMKFQG